MIELEIEHKPVERFNINKIRVSREAAQRRTFVVLNDNRVGFEIDRVHKTIAFFLYKEKKKNAFMMTEHISWYVGVYRLKHLLFSLISNYYKTIGKDHIPFYAETELSIPVYHFNYHVWAGTLEKALAKELT